MLMYSETFMQHCKAWSSALLSKHTRVMEFEVQPSVFHIRNALSFACSGVQIPVMQLQILAQPILILR